MSAVKEQEGKCIVRVYTNRGDNHIYYHTGTKFDAVNNALSWVVSMGFEVIHFEVVEFEPIGASA